MDSVNQLFKKFSKERLIFRTSASFVYCKYILAYRIDPNCDKYTKKEAVAVVLKWMLNGRY